MRSGKVLLLLFGFCFLPAPGLKAEEDRSEIVVFQSHKITKAPLIDGKLGDECWGGAQEYRRFWGRPRGAGKEVLVDHLGTTVKILQDEDNLYVGFDCPEPPLLGRVHSIPAPKDDDDVLKYDRVEVALDINHSHNDFYLLVVNSSGSQYDAHRKIGDKFNKEWNANWECGVEHRPDGWSIEIKIPFTGLPDAKGKVWGANFIRRRSYGLTGKSATSLTWGSIYVPPYWGDLYFEEPSVYLKKMEVTQKGAVPIPRITIARAENFSGKVVLAVAPRSKGWASKKPIDFSKVKDPQISVDINDFSRLISFLFDRCFLVVKNRTTGKEIFTASYPILANHEITRLISDTDKAALRLNELKHSEKMNPEVLASCEYLIKRINRLRPDDKPSLFLKRKLKVALWRAEDDLKELQATLELIDKGKDPFAGERGVFVRTYFSEVDRTRQPYRLFVPKKYDREKGKKHPLCLYLHGWFGTYRSEPFGFTEEYLDSGERDLFIAVLNGRGSLGFRHFARTEVLDVVEDIKKHYRIDQERIYVTGHSQGGMASYFLAGRMPDRFAALAPLSGSFDFGFFENVVTPLSIHQGEGDPSVPCDWSRLAYRELSRLGKDVDYYEYSNTEHSIHDAMIVNFDLPEWLLKYKRREAPKEVTLVCDSQLRYSRSYWVRIDGLLRQAEKGRLRARVKGDNMIEVESKNVSSFHLQMDDKLIDSRRPVSVIHNGKKTEFFPPFGGSIGLGEGLKADWKRPKLSGPIDDVYFERFLYVYGTGGDDEATEVNREEAGKLSRWSHSVTELPFTHLVRADTEITDEDIKEANLILIGGPDTNLITERIIERLPLKITGASILLGERKFSGKDVGIEMVYPNPLNPERYILLYAAPSPEGMKNLDDLPARRSPYDFLVFDNRSKKGKHRNFLFRGYFDRTWRLEEECEIARFSGPGEGLARLAADCVREACGADLAIVSGHLGVVPEGGIITRADLESNFPGRAAAILTIKGSDVDDMFHYWSALPEKYRRRLAISGFEINPDWPESREAPDRKNISTLEKEKYYSVAIDPALVAVSRRCFGRSVEFELTDLKIRDIVGEKLSVLKNVALASKETVE